MRGLFFLLALPLFTSTTSLAQGSSNTNALSNSTEIDYKMPGAPIPNFKVRLNNGKTVVNKDFAKYEQVMFVLFNPSCGHCLDFAKEVAQDKTPYKKTAIIFIAARGMESYLQGFLVETGLDDRKDKNILVGTDQTPKVGDGFEMSEFLFQLFEFRLPQINIYDKERKMICRKLGEVRMEEVKPFLK
jgi:thiol-disulfide isomerase/thioredoxin